MVIIDSIIVVFFATISCLITRYKIEANKFNLLYNHNIDYEIEGAKVLALMLIITFIVTILVGLL